MLPIDFTKRMKELLGEEYGNFEASYSEDPVRSFRINTNKISKENFEKINPFGGEKIPYAENGFYFSGDGIGNHPYHHAGMIYIQEPSAMAAVESVDIQPDWNILDLCASPGGKSTQAASQNPDGVLVSNEIVPSRCKTLTGNIERMGFQNVITTCADAKRIAALYNEAFDLVIVDAPCSGEGMFRKDENAQKEWSVENVLHCAERQREILDKIKTTVKPGGLLLYSTCTFSLEENEKNIDWFLNENDNFELIEVKDSVKKFTADGIMFDGCNEKNISRCRRFYPHVAKGEGQFIALMKKTDGIGIEEFPPSALKDISKKFIGKVRVLCNEILQQRYQVEGAGDHGPVVQFHFTGGLSIVPDDDPGGKAVALHIVIIADIVLGHDEGLLSRRQHDIAGHKFWVSVFICGLIGDIPHPYQHIAPFIHLIQDL